MERIQIQGINVTVTDAIEQHTASAFEGLVDRFNPSLCRLTFEKVKLDFNVTAILRNDDGEFVATGSGKELYGVITQQTKQLAVQIEKARRRRSPGAGLDKRNQPSVEEEDAI